MKIQLCWVEGQLLFGNTQQYQCVWIHPENYGIPDWKDFMVFEISKITSDGKPRETWEGKVAER